VNSVRVAARFQQKIADQPAGARSNARKLTTPINKPKGIDKEIVRDNAETIGPGHDDAIQPNKRDITPKDVFNLSPNAGGVLNLVQTGNDLSKAISKQVPKDKGYDTVNGLSQYLIRTDGGGGTPPVGKR
jgi:hypothetical protein